MPEHLKAFVSHMSVWMLGLLFLACLAVITPFLGHWSVWVAIVSGIAVFYVAEYLTHRFLFHRPPPKHPRLLKIFKRLHYDHHEFPDDLQLLFLPAWYSISNLIIVWLLAWAVTRSKMLAVCVVTGAVLALLYYEWTHFVAHRPIIPRTPWGKWMKSTISGTISKTNTTGNGFCWPYL
jgi:4-hydroxysphinganine ceramide fatty acyl 2-hydroxylase